MSIATLHIEKKKTAVPELRFKGFIEEWKQKRLGEIAKITTGSTPSTLIEEYYNGDKLFVSPADIQENRYVYKTKTTLTESGFSKGRKVAKGSVLFVCIGSTIGKIAQATEECLTNQQINALNATKDYDNNFIYELLEKNGAKIKLLAGVQAVPQINKTDFSNFKYFLPTIPEQQKIASFLSSVDEKIQQLSRKRELLEKYKKGVMQQLFSGKLRFKNENGEDYADWKWVGGNELFDNISDKKHNSDLPILAITQDQGAIPRDLINYQMTVTDASVASYKVVQRGDFIISLRTFQGGIEFSEYHGICSPAYNILRPSSEEVDKTFYKLYLKTSYYIKQLQKNLEGIRDGKMISYKYFSEIKLPFPSQPEQQKIAAYLTAIDTKIENTSQQINQMQSFKKGLLQQLFV